MELAALNPFIRFMDRRICRYSYKIPIVAYEHRLFYLCKGECQLLLENKSYTVRAGACLVFPGGLPYQFFFKEEHPVEMFVINFDLESAHADQPVRPPDACEAFEPEICIRPDEASVFDQPMQHHPAKELEEPLTRLLAEHEGREPYRQALGSAMLKAILIAFLRLNEGSAGEASGPVHELVAYLHEHFCEEITGQRLSAQFNYHAYYLGKCFRSQMGVSIHQYVLSLRLQKCIRLLISSTLSISEIARECGFSSAAYLSEYFKKVYKLSPRQYREKSRLA